jgi:uncharacterized protein (DUF2062 family)
MLRKVLKKKRPDRRIDALIEKYNIPKKALALNRRSVSRAFFVGFFVAFIPMPLQVVAVLLPLPFFRYNVPIAFSLVWITNPLTMPFIYYVEYVTGNLLLVEKGISNIEPTLEWFRVNLDAIFLPLYLGALFYSLLFAAGSLFLVNRLWINSVKREKYAKMAEQTTD